MKKVLVDAITFDELVKHGKETGGNIVNDMPWSFEYKGHYVTHENDGCYLIDKDWFHLTMTKKDMLLSFPNDELMTFDKESFDEMMKEIV